MTDSKKNPNKQRRSFFWQRKPCLPPDLTEPSITAEARQREGQPWYRPSLLKVAILRVEMPMKRFRKPRGLSWGRHLAVLSERSMYGFEQQSRIDHDCRAVNQENPGSFQAELPLALDVTLVH
jgi:hypothetical protein